jgi:hypothetical protein
MKKLFFLFLAAGLLLAFNANSAAAQSAATSTFSGKAVRWNGEAIAGATIAALRGPLETDPEVAHTTTAADGSYTLTVPASGTYWLHIRTFGTYWGYSYYIPFTPRAGNRHERAADHRAADASDVECEADCRQQRRSAGPPAEARHAAHHGRGGWRDPRPVDPARPRRAGPGRLGSEPPRAADAPGLKTLATATIESAASLTGGAFCLPGAGPYPRPRAGAFRLGQSLPARLSRQFRLARNGSGSARPDRPGARRGCSARGWDRCGWRWHREPGADGCGSCARWGRTGRPRRNPPPSSRLPLRWRRPAPR